MEQDAAHTFAAEVEQTVRMLLESGDPDYIMKLSLRKLEQALVHELRFLGLYNAGDTVAEQFIAAYLRTHLVELLRQMGWLKNRHPRSIQPRE